MGINTIKNSRKSKYPLKLRKFRTLSLGWKVGAGHFSAKKRVKDFLVFQKGAQYFSKFWNGWKRYFFTPQNPEKLTQVNRKIWSFPEILSRGQVTHIALRCMSPKGHLEHSNRFQNGWVFGYQVERKHTMGWDQKSKYYSSRGGRFHLFLQKIK